MMHVECNQNDIEILHCDDIWSNTENKLNISWIYIFQKPTQGLLIAIFLGTDNDKRAVCSLPCY